MINCWNVWGRGIPVMPVRTGMTAPGETAGPEATVPTGAIVARRRKPLDEIVHWETW